NSFPVSSALSAGGLVARFGNNSTSSPSLASSPVKFVSQAASSSQVPICIAISTNSSSSMSTIESSLASLTSGKSSLGSTFSMSLQPEISAITSNLNSTTDSYVSTASMSAASVT